MGQIPDQFPPAELGQDVVDLGGVVTFRGSPCGRNTGTVAVAERRQGGVVLRLRQGGEPPPFLVALGS